MLFSKPIEHQIRYFQRLASWIEVEELRQVAAVAALESAITYRKPQRRRHHKNNASLETYQARAVRFALSHHVDKMRSPASASNSSLAKLRGIFGLPIYREKEDGGTEEQDGMPRLSPAPEQGLDIEAAKVRLRAIISLLPAATQVLIHEEKPALVARKLRMRISLVYSQTRNLKRRLAHDEELRALVVG